MKLSVRYRHLGRALDVCHASPEKTHSWSQWELSAVRFLSIFSFLSFALAYIFAWHFEWSKKIIFYTFWMAWIHLHTHMWIYVSVCVFSLIVLTALVACAWLALWHSFLLLLLHLSAAAAAHTVPARSSRTPWPWLRGDLCKFVRKNTHFFSNCQTANQIFGWSKFPAARQGRQASYLKTNKHRNKLHISNGRRVFAPL